MWLGASHCSRGYGRPQFIRSPPNAVICGPNAAKTIGEGSERAGKATAAAFSMPSKVGPHGSEWTTVLVTAHILDEQRMRYSQAKQKSPARRLSLPSSLALSRCGGIAGINIRNAACYDEFVRMGKSKKLPSEKHFVA